MYSSSRILFKAACDGVVDVITLCLSLFFLRNDWPAEMPGDIHLCLSRHAAYSVEVEVVVMVAAAALVVVTLRVAAVGLGGVKSGRRVRSP